MHLNDLLNEWASTAQIEEPVMSMTFKLPLELSAHLMALKDMYPGRTLEQLTIDLLTAAVDELKEKMPYRQGENVVAEDEYGDPIYQDVGLTPQFLDLTQQYREKFKDEQEKL